MRDMAGGMNFEYSVSSNHMNLTHFVELEECSTTLVIPPTGFLFIVSIAPVNLLLES